MSEYKIGDKFKMTDNDKYLYTIESVSNEPEIYNNKTAEYVYFVKESYKNEYKNYIALEESTLNMFFKKL
jgi:dTDP-4-dehydrorhamnose 3,5-epimerase-like enzyme